MLDVVIMIGPFPDQPSLIRGGVQASVYGLSRALSRRGEVGRVRVLSLPLKHSAKTPVTTSMVDGLEVTRLNVPCKSFASTLLHLPLAMRTIRQADRPVVHVHGTGPFQAALLALLRLKCIRFVWTLHGITEKETLQRHREHPTAANLFRHRLYRFLERYSLRISPHIVVDTPYVEAEVNPAGNAVHVIPQGIFAEEFSGPHHGTPPGLPPLVLSLGVLSPRKGHHLMLEAFARVREKVPAARLVIAGTVTDPDHHERLKSRSAELGIADAADIRVDLPRREILALLGRARVFALHSQEESQGIALCEALAAGLPVVATRVGGIPHVIDDRDTGILVPYGDVPGFADALVEVLTDPQRHARMSARARQAGQRFDWDTIARQMACIYYNADNTPFPDDEAVEEWMQMYAYAGWSCDKATNVFTSPDDPELTISIDPSTRRYFLSLKQAMANERRVEYARKRR